MIPRRLSRLVAGLLLTATLACGGGDSNEPSNPNMAGQWVGRASKNGSVVGLLITLTDDGEFIEGEGGISGSGPQCTLGIIGTRSGGSFDLALKCAAFLPFSYKGTVHSNRLTGTFSGSGVPSVSLTLERR